MSEFTKPSRLFTLLLLISFASVTGLLFTPALPGLGSYFGISETEAQWTISIFLFGYCLGQLPYGPLANRFGRKKVIFIGVGLAVVGSLMAYSASVFWMLCIARFIQALGSAVGLKISFTMINDEHTGLRAAKAISGLSLAFGVMPGLAVAAGGYITALSNWRGCFLFLTFYSAFIGVLCLFLPETSKKLDLEAFKLKKIAQNYASQFKNPFLLIHALIVGLATAMIYIFATLSPYIGIKLIGLTPSQFGLWSLIPASGLLFGAFVSRNLPEKLDFEKRMSLGILLCLIGTLLMAICFTVSGITTWGLFCTQFLIQIGNNILWANASTRAISAATDKSNASAVVQFINVGGAVVGTLLIGLFSPTSAMLLPGAFGIILALMIMFGMITRLCRTSLE